MIISNQARMDAEVGTQLKSFSDSIDTILENVAKMRESTTTLINGIDCRFIDNTLTRVFYGLCGHLRNSIGGFTAIMIGAGLSNLIGVMFTIHLNLYLHQKKDPKKVYKK